MTEHLKNQLEKLLEEDGKSQPTERGRRLRARLAVDFSEGLEPDGARSGELSPLSSDPAAKAAFLDGSKQEADREAFIAALARDENLRADVESVASLLASVENEPLRVPAHLLGRARTEFAPDPVPGHVETAPRWQWSLLWSRRRMAWAIVAAVLAIAVIGPGVLLRDWSSGEPQLSADSEPYDPPTSCQDPDASGARPADQRPRGPRGAGADGRSPDATPDNPCATPVPARP